MGEGQNLSFELSLFILLVDLFIVFLFFTLNDNNFVI
jgi:hypothetical protein